MKTLLLATVIAFFSLTANAEMPSCHSRAVECQNNQTVYTPPPRGYARQYFIDPGCTGVPYTNETDACVAAAKITGSASK